MFTDLYCLSWQDFDESDSESVQDQVMETRQSPPAELEGDPAEETDATVGRDSAASPLWGIFYRCGIPRCGPDLLHTAT